MSTSADEVIMADRSVKISLRDNKRRPFWFEYAEALERETKSVRHPDFHRFDLDKPFAKRHQELKLRLFINVNIAMIWDQLHVRWDFLDHLIAFERGNACVHIRLAEQVLLYKIQYGACRYAILHLFGVDVNKSIEAGISIYDLASRMQDTMNCNCCKDIASAYSMMRNDN